MFHHSFCRNLNFRIRDVVSSKSPHLGFLFRFISTKSEGHKHYDFTVHYLTNSCGLSPESALKAAQKAVFKSTTNPDSILTLFKSYGLTQPQISKLVARRPLLLMSNPIVLKPKLDFFTNIGISRPDLGKILSRDPTILRTSLDNQISPAVGVLKSLVHTDYAVAGVLSRSTWFLAIPRDVSLSNISILRDHQVPEAHISKFIMMNRGALCLKTEHFNELVVRVKEMNVCPSGLRFIRCLHVLSTMKKPLWDAKVAIFKGFGWSEDEVLDLFRRDAFMLASSVQKLTTALDFFVNTLKWTRSDIEKRTIILRYGFENWIIPRWAVLQMLLSKGLIDKGILRSALLVTEVEFLKKYVNRYQQQVPRLLKLYQSKKGAQESIVSNAPPTTS